MSSIRVHVSATVGSEIHAPRTSGGAEPERLTGQGRAGWPVGWGQVDQSLTYDGRQAEALVLMCEPAVAGVEITARPIALLRLTDEHPDVLCVASDACFDELASELDLRRWHADVSAWATALDRLSPGHAGSPTEYGSRQEAEHLLDETHRMYLRLTGCMDEV